MWKAIKNWYNDIRTNGVKFYFASTAGREEGNVSLFFAYISFWMSVASLVGLHFSKSFLYGTIAVMSFWSLSMIFYLVGRIGSAKFDIDDKFIEIQSDKK